MIVIELKTITHLWPSLSIPLFEISDLAIRGQTQTNPILLPSTDESIFSNRTHWTHSWCSNQATRTFASPVQPHERSREQRAASSSPWPSARHSLRSSSASRRTSRLQAARLNRRRANLTASSAAAHLWSSPHSPVSRLERDSSSMLSARGGTHRLEKPLALADRRRSFPTPERRMWPNDNSVARP